MADTGWVRFVNYSDPNSNWTNPDNLTSGNSGDATSTATAPIPLVLNNANYSIPAGSVITGIAYRIKAKYSGTGTTPDLITYLRGVNQDHNGTQTTTTLTTTLTEYEVGGDGNLQGLRVGENFKIFDLNIDIDNPSGLTVTVEGSESTPSPAVKIYYDPPPDGTQVTDWIRFGDVYDNSADWFFYTDPTVLESGNTGQIWWNNPSTLPYAIFDTPDSFGIPSNATITGIQFQLNTTPSLLGTSLSPNQTWDGKMSLSSLGTSDLTDSFFTITNDDVLVNARSYITGSYNNLFGLSLTPSNISNLNVGFKCTNIGHTSYGELSGTTTSPAVRLFYTVPGNVGKIFLTSGRLSLTSGRLSLS